VFTVYLAASHRPAPASLLALSRSLVLPAAFLLGIALLFPSRPFVLALPLAEGVTFLLGVALLCRRSPELALGSSDAGVAVS
jgi:hypothetical protein